MPSCPSQYNVADTEMLTREGDIWWRGKPDVVATAASARLGVGASPFYESLGERFRNRMDAGTFTWLASKLEHGARPHHSFHVFEVYLRAVLMRGNHANIAPSTAWIPAASAGHVWPRWSCVRGSWR
jgi:hypothetical protein